MLQVLCGEDKALQNFELITQQCEDCRTAWYYAAMLGKNKSSMWKAIHKFQKLIENDEKARHGDDSLVAGRMDAEAKNMAMAKLARLLDRMGLYEEAFNAMGKSSIYIGNSDYSRCFRES